jgi:hypothetical protein
LRSVVFKKNRRSFDALRLFRMTFVSEMTFVIR